MNSQICVNVLLFYLSIISADASESENFRKNVGIHDFGKKSLNDES